MINANQNKVYTATAAQVSEYVHRIGSLGCCSDGSWCEHATSGTQSLLEKFWKRMTKMRDRSYYL